MVAWRYINCQSPANFLTIKDETKTTVWAKMLIVTNSGQCGTPTQKFRCNCFVIIKLVGPICNNSQCTTNHSIIRYWRLQVVRSVIQFEIWMSRMVVLLMVLFWNSFEFPNYMRAINSTIDSCQHSNWLPKRQIPSATDATAIIIHWRRHFHMICRRTRYNITRSWNSVYTWVKLS